MNYLGRVIGNLKGLYSGINGATLTGAIDVVIVEQEDGTFNCSPFHVRFGKLGVLRSREKVVDIELNGVAAPIRMKLGDSGEAFFVQEAYDFDLDDENLATSPLPASPQMSDSDRSSSGGGGGRIRGDTEESTDDNLRNPNKQTLDKNGNAVNEDDDHEILLLEDYSNQNPTDTNKTESLTGTADPKNRKRRRKKRRNQGSKSNIILDNENNEETTGDEGIFKMDEELQGINEALIKLEISGMSRNRSHHHLRDFYSDTEIYATSTPQNSRPSTPIQSDSEYEIHKIQHVNGEVEGKWAWGQLPTANDKKVVSPEPPTTTLPMSTPMGTINIKLGPTEKKLSSSYDERMTGRTTGSMLGSMFSFMTKRQQVSGREEASGIYLDDLNPDKIDPEMAALYFPNFDRDTKGSPKREQDEDSGKGSSIVQSPSPGSSPKSGHISIYMDEQRKQNEVRPSTPTIPKFEAISICGSNLALFEQSQLSFDELVENPEIILNASPDSIVVKLDGKFIPWSAALPQLLSTTFFKRPLPSQLHEKLVNQQQPPISRSNSVSSGTSRRSYSSWFPWRRSTIKSDDGGDLDKSVDPESPVILSQSLSNYSSETSPLILRGQGAFPPRDSLPRKESSSTSSSDESEGGHGSSSHIKPIPPPPLNVTNINGGHTEKYKKSLRLTSDQIAALDLRYGQNEAVFSVTTAYQGTTVARCHIYLWRYDDRVVISDIDGTITKSDVLGHILPIIGTDWAQSGVAQLFTQIQDNGYKMLYLSARAIGQATSTREYLRSIKQDDVTLPDGPLLLSPTSLMSAFHREVIEKKPEEFKIACLRDIQTLFPSNPFYAGYGNKINDVWAYRAVDIAIPRIFTINHKGELRHALTNTFQSSYTSLVELAEFIFPAYKTFITEEEKDQSTDTFTTTDGFSSFEFWRDPVPELPGIGSFTTATAVTAAS